MNKYTDVRLIGLIGKAGSGKDTLADEIAPLGWEKVAFADSLKHMCMDYLGLSYEDAYTQEGKMRMNPEWGVTNRTILQKVGTDAMRNGFDKDVWVKILQMRIRKMLDEGRKAVITDCRFDNEARMVEGMGGLIVEVVRDSQSQNLSAEEQKHASEQPVNRGFVAFTVDNNGQKSMLKRSFEAQLALFGARHSGIASRLSAMVDDGRMDRRLAELALLDSKKFITSDPALVLRCGRDVLLEWGATKTRPECALSLGEKGIIVEAASLKEPIRFGFGDAAGWKLAMDFING